MSSKKLLRLLLHSNSSYRRPGAISWQKFSDAVSPRLAHGHAGPATFSTCVLIGWALAPASYVLLLLHRLYLFAVLGDQVLQLWLWLVDILDGFWLPIYFPALFVVQLVDDVVDVADLSLDFGLSVVFLSFDMSFEIFVVVHANLTIGVVCLGLWHCDNVSCFSENTFGFGHLKYLCSSIPFCVNAFDSFKFLLAVLLLVEGHARIHSFWPICY